MGKARVSVRSRSPRPVRLGQPFPIHHANKSGLSQRDDKLTRRQIDTMLQITQADYRLLGAMYDINTAENALAA